MKVLSQTLGLLVAMSLVASCAGSSKGRTGFKTQPKAPVVANVTSSTSNGGYDLLSVVNIQVGFNDTVNVTGIPTITLETGATDRVVNYTSGSGSATLTFSYTVQAGDVSADLDYVSETALQLAGGTIKSTSSGLAANLTLPDVGEANSLGGNKDLVIGSIWNFVDGDNGTSGINVDTGLGAFESELVVNGSQLFAFWREQRRISSVYQIRAKRYSGTAWVAADGGADDGLNKDPTREAHSVQPVIYDGDLHAVWTETDGTAYQIRAASYNGTAWTFVDGNLTTGLNKNTALNADVPSAAVFGSNLYVAWDEVNAGPVSQIRVKRYNGSSWTFVDGDGANGLNHDVLEAATRPKLAVFGANLYAAWTEGSPSQIRVRRYNGSSWTFVDGDGLDGLNRESAREASDPSFAVYDEELYLSWSEENSLGVKQIRVQKYDGTSWTFVDGNNTSGLNKDAGLDAASSSFVVHNAGLYLSWNEGSPGQLRVAKFNGTQWAFVDGDDVDGLNKIPSNNAVNGNIISFNSQIYATWAEFAPLGNIRIVRYQ